MNLLHSREELNEDKLFQLVSSLKKVEAFFNCHNMSTWNIWENMNELVVCFKDSMVAQEKIKIPVDAALLAYYYVLLWD